MSKFVSEKYHLLGDSDFECKGPVMYLRFDDLGDAQTIYKVLKETQPDLTIKYVHSSAYGEVRSFILPLLHLRLY
jgi:hypothetical protein